MRFFKKLAVGMGAMAVSVASFAQTSGSGSDPTAQITSQLGTYLTDVGSIVTAVLLIVYGKKLLSYLRV